MAAKSKHNRKVVVVDLDGVLVDFYFSMTKYFHTHFGKPEYPMSSYQAAGWGVEEMDLTKEHLDEFWNWVYEGAYFWRHLREMEPGIVKDLGFDLVGYTVYFCTTREDTKQESAQCQSNLWLRHHGWPHPNVIVSDHKGEFCYSVDAAYFVDDKFSNCAEVCEKSPNTKVFWLALPSQRRFLEDAKKYNMTVIYHLREFSKAVKIPKLWDVETWKLMKSKEALCNSE